MSRTHWFTIAIILFFALLSHSILTFAQTPPNNEILAPQLAQNGTPNTLPPTVTPTKNQEHDREGLFIDVGMRSKDYTNEATVIRGRFVNIDFDFFNVEDGFRTGQQLVLNLFDDVLFTAVLERVESNPSGSYTWLGQIDGIEHSQVAFVVRDGLMVGHVSIPMVNGTYQVRYAGNNLHEVVQVNASALMPDQDDAVSVDLPAQGPSRPAIPNLTDDGSVIDLMIVYTDDVRKAAGGTAAIESQIELVVAAINQMYKNSQVNQQLFLVHMEEVLYEETGSGSDDLANIRTGRIPNVHAWRNTYHADETLFVVSTNYGGLAYLMEDVEDMRFERIAFGVVGTARSPHTWAHELGHNMGLRHDWYQNDGITPFTYAHGYVNNDSNSGWRTVMAYDWLCRDEGFNCPSVPYFSNPNIRLRGEPMGVPGGTAANCKADELTPNPSSCDADAHSVLNASAPTVAQFRSSVLVWTGATSSDWRTASNWTMAEGSPFTITNVSRVPRLIDNVFIPANTPNTPLIRADADVRDVLIEEDAALNMSGGTLTVYGDWEEQGTGVFNASGGTVVFKSPLNQSIESHHDSNFNHLQIGDGIGTQKVALLDGTHLEIKGNLTLKAGVSFEAGNSTISLTGNWQDEGNGFVAGTSTVMLDGASQILQKPDESVLLSEDFSAWDGSDDFFYAPPARWAAIIYADGRFNRWGFGDSRELPNYPYHGGFARRSLAYDDTNFDAWLFSPALTLHPDTIYQLDFIYGIGKGSDPQGFAAYYGNDQASSDMTTQIFNQPSASNITWNPAESYFTVPNNGTYHIGFRNFDASPTAYSTAGIDNIVLTARQELIFYNLIVNSRGDGAILKNSMLIKNDLLVNQGALVNLEANELAVEGTVRNLGALQQSKEISDGTGSTTYEFLTIKNKAQNETKYYGVNITPDGNAALGWTSVHISGNQSCTTNSSDSLINRCFNITAYDSNSATIKFWLTNAEQNKQSANALKMWHHNGSRWTQIGQNASYGSVGSTCGTDAECWTQWRGISDFYPMVIGSGNTPTGHILYPPLFPHFPPPLTTPTSTPVPNISPTPMPTSANWQCWNDGSLDPCHRTLAEVELVTPSDGWAVGDGLILRLNNNRWSISEQFSDIKLYGLHMISPTNGWAVGSAGTILHWDGNSWNHIASPVLNWLESVSMLNENEGWAVGSGGTIIRWHENKWTRIDSPTDHSLYAVKMFSATSGWATGANGTILKWDGNSWIEEFSLPEQTFRAIDVISSTEAWVVGDNGVIMHRQNGKWRNVESPVTSRLYSIKILNRTNGWAVGSSGRILHWDGNSWSEVTRQTSNGLRDLSFLFNGVAVGSGGTILQWNGSEWRASEESAYSWLFSVDMLNNTDAWAVGLGGVTLHWDGSNWNQVSNPTSNSLYSVDMINHSDVWAVGSGGAILNWNGTGWNEHESRTSEKLSEVKMINSNLGWAVGDNGTILRWNGNNWAVIPSPTSENLNSIALLSNKTGWIVGDHGTLLRWNGNIWSEVNSPTDQDLSSITMNSSTSGWAVGTKTILHWDGNTWKILPSNHWLYGVTMNGTSGWIVASNGSTRYWNGHSWNFLSSPTSNPLYSAATNGIQSWAVGGYGTILQINHSVGPTATPTSPPKPTSTPRATPTTSPPKPTSTPRTTPTSGQSSSLLYLPIITR